MHISNVSLYALEALCMYAFQILTDSLTARCVRIYTSFQCTVNRDELLTSIHPSYGPSRFHYLPQNTVPTFESNGVCTGEEDGDAIRMAFSKKQVEDRKTWLSNYVPGTYLDQRNPLIPYKEFIHKVRPHFTPEDVRSMRHVNLIQVP